MAKTLARIQAQIDKLQKEAQAIRDKEAAGVIVRIRDAITHYGLTSEDLFGAKAVAAKKTRKAAASPAAKKAPGAPKYRDDAGHSWTGRGKRPNWFKDALAAGKTAADLEIKG